MNISESGVKVRDAEFKRVANAIVYLGNQKNYKLICDGDLRILEKKQLWINNLDFSTVCYEPVVSLNLRTGELSYKPYWNKLN